MKIHFIALRSKGENCQFWLISATDMASRVLVGRSNNAKPPVNGEKVKKVNFDELMDRQTKQIVELPARD